MDSLKGTVVKSIINDLKILEKKFKDFEFEFDTEHEFKLSNIEDYGDTFKIIFDSLKLNIHGCKITYSDCEFINNNTIKIDLTTEKWTKVSNFHYKLRQILENSNEFFGDDFFEDEFSHKTVAIDCSSVIGHISNNEILLMYMNVFPSPSRYRIRNNHIEVLYTYYNDAYGLTLGDLYEYHKYKNPENTLTVEEFGNKINQTLGINIKKSIFQEM